MNLSRPMRVWRCAALLALILTDTLHATDAVVSPPNCNEAGFNNALTAVNASSGGTITFNCGSVPLTIAFTPYKGIGSNVVIDGANRPA